MQGRRLKSFDILVFGNLVSDTSIVHFYPQENPDDDEDAIETQNFASERIELKTKKSVKKFA
jgi:hypothetical protein